MQWGETVLLLEQRFPGLSIIPIATVAILLGIHTLYLRLSAIILGPHSV